MAKHARVTTEEQRTRLANNRTLLAEVISGKSMPCADGPQSDELTLVLERFVVPEDKQDIVPFEGARGVERLLAELTDFSYGRIVQDGHLVGVEGSLVLHDHGETLQLRCTVGAGAQLVLEVGPSSDLALLLEAIDAFDRHVHLAVRSLGCTYRLIAQGYHPYATNPSDIVVVPTAPCALTNAYLSRTGRLTRDMMRCTAATCVRLSLPADESTAVAHYRLACALAPILAFLCDNSLKVRNRTPEDTPRMVRSLVWKHVDNHRCGIVPGTFLDDFGPTTYQRWAEGIAPIYFASSGDVSFSTGNDTLAQVMEERELSADEARELLRHLYPWARWDGQLELRAVDALPPRQALGYAALVKALFGDEQTRLEAEKLLGMSELEDVDVEQAFDDLRAQGWDARVYGRPIAQIAHELAALASRALPVRAERELLDSLAQLWEVGIVPRDVLIHSWERTRPRTPEEEAALRWGEGAVVPYESLQGEPPAGSTSVMNLERLRQDS